MSYRQIQQERERKKEKRNWCSEQQINIKCIILTRINVSAF